VSRGAADCGLCGAWNSGNLFTLSIEIKLIFSAQNFRCKLEVEIGNWKIEIGTFNLINVRVGPMDLRWVCHIAGKIS
jgi:hypothetical protein